MFDSCIHLRVRNSSIHLWGWRGVVSLLWELLKYVGHGRGSNLAGGGVTLQQGVKTLSWKQGLTQWVTLLIQWYILFSWDTTSDYSFNFFLKVPGNFNHSLILRYKDLIHMYLTYHSVHIYILLGLFLLDVFELWMPTFSKIKCFLRLPGNSSWLNVHVYSKFKLHTSINKTFFSTG